MTKMHLADLEPLIRQLYARFNARSTDAVLDSLTADVAWANGMDGWHVHGRDAGRACSTRQFGQIRSSVTIRSPATTRA